VFRRVDVVRDATTEIVNIKISKRTYERLAMTASSPRYLEQLVRE